MDAAKLEELKNALRPEFERHGVRLAFLFGSQATGRTHGESDTDIAILLPEGLESKAAFEVVMQLLDKATRHLRSEAVDVVALNEGTPLLRFEVLSKGKLLYCRSKAERVAFQVRTCLEYEDTAPLRETLAAAMFRRIRSGRFGRSALQRKHHGA